MIHMDVGGDCEQRFAGNNVEFGSSGRSPMPVSITRSMSAPRTCQMLARI
jgi:hypothetical protein